MMTTQQAKNLTAAFRALEAGAREGVELAERRATIEVARMHASDLEALARKAREACDDAIAAERVLARAKPLSKSRSEVPR